MSKKINTNKIKSNKVLFVFVFFWHSRRYFGIQGKSIDFYIIILYNKNTKISNYKERICSIYLSLKITEI